ncbi:2-succinyl-5-enolpyruvyl-6-hydroxy-3-cyclohexene-1-carboxylate synthase, partial [Pasteurella multocida subsp. multocida str. Anand1_cattle]
QQQTDQKEVLMHANWDHWRTMRGVIVVGRLPVEQTMGIMAWANTMGWIALTDVQSSVEASLPYADIWLANQTVKQKLLQADIVIQFGSGFISKRVNQFLAAFKQNIGLLNKVRA